MAENIDIYDANLNHVGVMERLQAHREGQWHRTFHCWLVGEPTRSQPTGRLLFQGRSMTMRNYPGLLDVTAAGHLEAGESIEDGVREVTEELGVELDLDKAAFLGERVEVADQTNGQRNREYQSVYLSLTPAELPEFMAEAEEVASLLWLDINSGIKLFTGDVTTVRMIGYSFENDAKKWLPVEREVSVSDFLPRIQRYYLTTLIMSERLLAKKEPLAIS